MTIPGTVMSEVTEPLAKTDSRAADVDLSAEIAQSVAREFDERVTCRQVSGNSYRCNWWSPSRSKRYDNPRMEGLLVTTHVVTKSRFLNVSKVDQRLVINDAPKREGLR
jgi:hypothetical protein